MGPTCISGPPHSFVEILTFEVMYLNGGLLLGGLLFVSLRHLRGASLGINRLISVYRIRWPRCPASDGGRLWQVWRYNHMVNQEGTSTEADLEFRCPLRTLPPLTQRPASDSTSQMPSLDQVSALSELPVNVKASEFKCLHEF